MICSAGRRCSEVPGPRPVVRLTYCFGLPLWHGMPKGAPPCCLCVQMRLAGEPLVTLAQLLIARTAQRHVRHVTSIEHAPADMCERGKWLTLAAAKHGVLLQGLCARPHGERCSCS